MTKVLALFTSEQGAYKALPETSALLSEKQIVPMMGDSVAVAGDDYLLFKTEATDATNVRKVSKRYFNYPDCDIAIILDDFSYHHTNKNN